jgi:hypothetical protein
LIAGASTPLKIGDKEYQVKPMNMKVFGDMNEDLIRSRLDTAPKLEDVVSVLTPGMSKQLVADIIYGVAKARKEYLEPEFDELYSWSVSPVNIAKLVWYCVEEKAKSEISFESLAIAIQIEEKNGGNFMTRWKQLSGLESEANPETSATAS